jgi:hypothetical protein
MLSTVNIWNGRLEKNSWPIIPFAAALSYLTTIIANSTRIAIALWLRGSDTQGIGLDGQQFHRLEGIVVYFGFLLGLYFLNEKVMSESFKTTSLDLRKLVLPLVIYYGVTIVIPIMNAADLYSTGFWEHTAFVLLVPIILILPFAAFRLLRPARIWL